MVYSKQQLQRKLITASTTSGTTLTSVSVRVTELNKQNDTFCAVFLMYKNPLQTKPARSAG